MPLQDELREYITVSSLKEKVPEGFSDDYNLIEKEALDSLAFMELITHLADHYRIELDEEDITPENFGTINMLASFVESKLT